MKYVFVLFILFLLFSSVSAFFVFNSFEEFLVEKEDKLVGYSFDSIKQEFDRGQVRVSLFCTSCETFKGRVN